MRRRHALLLSLLATAAVIALTVGLVRTAGLRSEPAGSTGIAPIAAGSGEPVNVDLIAAAREPDLSDAVDDGDEHGDDNDEDERDDDHGEDDLDDDWDDDHEDRG